jgi:hypothetical protein
MKTFADFANLKWETTPVGNDPMMGIPLENPAVAMIAGDETLTVIDNLGICGLLRAIVGVARAKVEHCAEKDILMACKWRYVAATLSNTANHIGGM